MTDTPEVHQVYIHIKPVSRALPTGRVAYGFYTLVDGVVTMTNQKGEPAHDDTGKTYTHKLESNDDAHIITGRLTQKLRDTLIGKKDAPPAGFGAPLRLSENEQVLMRRFKALQELLASASQKGM
jgi:hypothetical protein